MYATPIIYPVTIVSAAVPVGALAQPADRGRSRGSAGRCSEARRRATAPSAPASLIAAVLVVTGLFYFRRAERTLVDLI